MQSCIKLCIKTTKERVGGIQNSKFKIQNYEEQVLVSSSRLGIAQVNLLSALAPQRRFKIQNYEEEYSLPPRNDKFSASTNE